MPIPKFEITNPEAIEFINKFKSGEIYKPILDWIRKNRWYLIGAGVILMLIIALAIGKQLSQSAQTPVYTPPEIETVSPTVEETVKSSFSGLKKEIQDMNTDLPDPFIPTFDNNINLEEQAQ